jgi:two-component system sensor histidine kinase GlrK
MQAGTTLDRVIQSAVEYERDGAQGRGVPVELIQRGDLPALCLDGALLERAIANLIRNAVSVSPPGSSVKVIREQLSTDPEGREGSWVRIGVEDQGPGVSPELRAQLFVPFVSHEVASAGRPAGVGLGLALSREIARAHGGDLFLENSPPPGAVFSIWLPLQLPLSAASLLPSP